MESETAQGDISKEIRIDTAENGQKPYAIIVSCSDSRVIPEYIFSAGIGELFVIRIVGNVLDRHQLGSIEYAAEHLGVRLIVMLGHTRCGAIDSVIEGHGSGRIGYILKDIEEAVGGEKDEFEATCMNVRHGVERIRREFAIDDAEGEGGLEVVGAIYHIEDGRVEFLEE